MDINQLRYFQELVVSGSFTKAAENMEVSQPALSTRIKQLEEEVELLLIDRSRKPLQLTKDGERFFEIVKEVLDRIEALKNLSFDLQEEVVGVLKIGVIPTLAPYFIPMFIDKLNKEYPLIKLYVEELVTEDVIHKIRAGHLDGGIIATPVEAGKLQLEPLFYEKFFLYVSDKHPLYNKEFIRLEDINTDELWYLREGNCFQNQVNTICKLPGRGDEENQFVYETNSIESLRRIVEHKKGITFIPELATLMVPADQEDMIKSIEGDQSVREISLVYASVYAKRNLMEALMNIALSQLPKHMKQNKSGQVIHSGLKIS